MFLKAFLRKSLLLSLLIVAGTLDGQAQKLTPEEIIAKDVASLGAAKLLTQSRNLMAIAGCEFVMHIPERQIPGRAVLASDGSSLAFFSKFNSDDYPMERIGIFGEKVNVRTVYRQKEPERGGIDVEPTSPLRSGGGVGNWNADLANNSFTLTEDFDDIRSDLRLMLPHKYSISVLFDGTNGTAERDWNLRIEEYRLIREFPADFFTFGGQ